MPGRGLVLTDLSVVDPCFWTLSDEVGATTIAGVPHSFDLLDRSGFTERTRPSLRIVTQAGGRLAAATRAALRGARPRTRLGPVRRCTGRPRRPPGWRSCPPTSRRPARRRSVGRYPDGSFRLEPTERELDCGLGELVYSGPNVMLGYAESAADLARGREVHELRTGDLARSGRTGWSRSSVAAAGSPRSLGLRIDLDQVERDLAATGHQTHCVDLGGRPRRPAPRPRHAAPRDEDRDPAARHTGVGVVVLDGLEAPRLATGKPDYPGMAELLGAHRAQAAQAAVHRAPTRAPLVVDLYRTSSVAPSHRRPTRPSFADLGGDSLSYVEVSVRLEACSTRCPTAGTSSRRASWLRPPDSSGRGHPPAGCARSTPTSWCAPSRSCSSWPTTPTCPSCPEGRTRCWPSPATTWPGSSSPPAPAGAGPRDRAQRGRVVLPSAAWIGVVALVAGTYDWRNVLMLNQVLGDWAQWSDHWHYWFIEAVTSLLARHRTAAGDPRCGPVGAAVAVRLPPRPRGSRPADAVCRARSRTRGPTGAPTPTC